MQSHVEFTREAIARPQPATDGGSVGAWVEFSGIVRGEENGGVIAALEYEAYDSMADRVMRGLLETLGARHGCDSAHVIHRLGVVPVGESAIWIGVGSGHRREALALVTEFMDQLKQDVPIWKRRALTAEELARLSS